VEIPGFLIVSKLLQPGERIIWQSQPNPWVAARQVLPTLLFMTFWTGGVLFGAWNLMFSPRANTNVSFGLVVISVMVIFGGASWFRTLKSFFRCWDTIYVLTDRRLVIAAGRDTRSFTGVALGDLSRTGGDERGSIRLSGINAGYSGYARRYWGLDASDGLYGIQNPAGVEALIYQTLIMPKGGSR